MGAKKYPATFYARDMCKNCKMQLNVPHFNFPASPGFVRRLCDGGLTIASRETTPHHHPFTPTPVHFNDTAYFYSAFLKDKPLFIFQPTSDNPHVGPWMGEINCVCVKWIIAQAAGAAKRLDEQRGARGGLHISESEKFKGLQVGGCMALQLKAPIYFHIIALFKLWNWLK